MARTISEGFSLFLDCLVPLRSQRDAAASHRASVESSLSNAMPIRLFCETGSFTHGTGVRNHTDVDLLASIGRVQPASPDTALSWVKTALSMSFPNTTVRISRPTVVVEFASGTETWEILPGFITDRGSDSISVYNIPGPSSGWIDSAPTAHLKYVTTVNTQNEIKGAAKQLARLAKAWKYYNNVPISSFYLEMRAANYMSTQKSFIPVFDICYFLEDLDRMQLASMNDPLGASGRFSACSSEVKKSDALSKLSTGATRARKALEAHSGNDAQTAFSYLNLLFGGKFPAR
ncbi:SMODS domain-containing nucleotidyltransferase [Streptomyces odontomachi]|uniref:SMODS domain-containing nucleotidyltransferase n=1 Tax=Streptomyces odontomachi TaxID=2944940 RepID=UPI00210E61F7|nr:nucleotidyltransferase [Streptomyces sp. ODS25]